MICPSTNHRQTDRAQPRRLFFARGIRNRSVAVNFVRFEMALIDVRAFEVRLRRCAYVRSFASGYALAFSAIASDTENCHFISLVGFTLPQRRHALPTRGA